VSKSELVSVVIPCFNAEATIRHTIECVLTQTWPNLEIIVVDDGSTDGSTGVLLSFENKITTEFSSHQGVSAARNRGTALAAGAYIQYLDADDLLAPEAIEQRLSALRSSGADIAYSDWQRFETSTDGERHLGEIVARRIEDISLDSEIACATAFWAPPAALLYRRHVVDAIGGWNERLPIIQDARFLFDAAHRSFCFVHVPGVSAFYRTGGASLSSGNQGRFMLDVYRNAIEIHSIWQAAGTLTAPRKAALAGAFDMTARAFFRLGFPEFDDAVARLSALSGRRFTYPHVAHTITQLAGWSAAICAIEIGAQLARGLRSLRDRMW
jgi:glycosyltransferase involved in cell wall biosynthesis